MIRKHKYLSIVEGIKSHAQAAWNSFLTAEDGFIVAFPVTFWGLGGGSGSAIGSIQQVSIIIGDEEYSNTATISAVNTAFTIIIPQGGTTGQTSDGWVASTAYLSLTDSTTVTATRSINANSLLTLNFAVIEFSTGVNSIQSGTIFIINEYSATASINTVGPNAFVIYTGTSAYNGDGSFANSVGAVSLTDSNTVTAYAGSTFPQLIVGYIVADMNQPVVNSVQQMIATFPENSQNLTGTNTISSVTPDNCLIIYGGVTGSVGTICNWVLTRLDLTNSTTVTFTRSSEGLNEVNTYYTVVEFASGILNGSVQRGDIALSSSTSNTATITSVNTSKVFVNYAGQQADTIGYAAAEVNLMNLTLTNSTTVTTNTYTDGSPVISYEVIQFI